MQRRSAIHSVSPCFSVFRHVSLTEAESRRGGVEKAAAESGVMKTQKFTWSKEGAKSFEWRKIYHALVGQVGPGEGGLLAEALITPTSMRTGVVDFSPVFFLFLKYFQYFHLTFPKKKII